MKKFFMLILTVFILGCSNTQNTSTPQQNQYATTDLILNSIIATALYNNHGVEVGESKIKTKSNSSSISNTNTTFTGNGSTTKSVTKTTTKTKSKGISYGLGF